MKEDSYKRIIKTLGEENTRLIRERNSAQNELGLKTRWIVEKFEWWSELLELKQTPSLKYLIKDTARILGAKFTS